jgi:hypothetical protein
MQGMSEPKSGQTIYIKVSPNDIVTKVIESK